ncbi:BspA family leucine-rich repeat surface protein [Mycoplasma cottewii]|uniref:BspA family leucine-rich repeat surface protein n=1 Tax=Mycoplasma cottewii TaxID=51364 RepID=A0ABY5TXA6_9MOLU|nr:BspA family leucine-rich repeat surface protein [Mycoplasma cottewii]UWD35315.1 BspA family leucine-rich repeat surface protein [Mycoplasma cottewii]
MTNLLMILKSVLAVSAANQGAAALNNDQSNLALPTSLKQTNYSNLLQASSVSAHSSHIIFGNQILKLGWEKSANGGYRLKQIPSHIKKVPSTLPSHITDLSFAFKGNINTDIEGIRDWDTSQVTNMSGVFYNAQKFNSALNWDTSKVTDMSYMFYNAENFNSHLGDKFSAINVTNMQSMFEGAREFNQKLGFKLLSNNRVNAQDMFKFAKNFNQDISFLEVEQKNVRETVFKNADSIKNSNLPLSVDSIVSNQIKKELISFWNNNFKNKQTQNNTYETVLQLLKLKIQEYSKLNGIKIELINQKDNVKTVELKNNPGIDVKVNDRFLVRLDLGTGIKENISEVKNNIGEIGLGKGDEIGTKQVEIESLNKHIINKFISTNENLVSHEVADYKVEHSDLASAIIRNVKTNDIHVVNYKLERFFFTRFIHFYDFYGFPELAVDESITTNRTFQNVADLMNLKIQQYTPKIYHNIKVDVVRANGVKHESYLRTGRSFYNLKIDHSNAPEFIFRVIPVFTRIDENKANPSVLETIYIDKNGNEQRVAGDMNGSEYDDVKVIKRIGFYWDYEKEQCVAYRMPKNVEVVPDYLPIEITSLENMFMGCVNFNQDLSSWNTQNVKLMTRMFQWARKFNNGGHALNWNTSKVTNMGAMFQGAESFNADITSWNVGKVTNLGEMFRDAKSFNQAIGAWNPRNTVVNYNNMLNGAISFNQNLTDYIKWPVYAEWVHASEGFDTNTPSWEIVNRPPVKPSSAKQIDTNGVAFTNADDEPKVIYGIKSKHEWEAKREIKEKLRSVYNLNPESLEIEVFKENGKVSRVNILPKSNGWYSQKGRWGDFTIESKDNIRNVIKENTHIGYINTTERVPFLRAVAERFNIDTAGMHVAYNNDDLNSGRVKLEVLFGNENFANGREQWYHTTINFTLTKHITTLGKFDTSEIVIDRNDQSLFEQEFINRNQELLNRNHLNKNLLSFKQLNNWYEISINNGEYIGSIKVPYRVKVNLNELQSLVTHVGNFNVKDIDAIISEFLKRNKDKLPELQRNHLRLVDSGEDFLTLSVNTEIQDKYLGEKIVVHFGSRANINNIGLNLNQVIVNNRSEQEIFDIFWERNQEIFANNNIQKDELKIELKDNHFVITTNNDNFYGEVRANFSVRTQIDATWC